MKSISCVGPVRACARVTPGAPGALVYQQCIREPLLFLRVPHSGCPTAARPNIGGKKSPSGAARPQSEVHNKHVQVVLFNVPALLNHGPSRLERECALARGNPHRAQPCERQMRSQDVPRDWVCNPSSPPLPSPPLPLSWLMITRQQTATPPHDTDTHKFTRSVACRAGQSDVNRTEERETRRDVMMILETISLMNKQQEKENTKYLSATVRLWEVPSSLNRHGPPQNVFI